MEDRIGDTGRQWGESLAEINADHIGRYRWAAKRIGGLVLDAACGTGYGSKILRDEGDATGVVGVDISPEAVKWACHHFPGPLYLVGDIQRGFFPGSRFEVVVSMETIEHLPSARLALKNFLRLSDQLVMSVPNEAVWAFKAEEHRFDKYPHVRHYTATELEDLLTDVGYTEFDWATQYDKNAEDVTDDKRDGRFILVHARR